MSQVGVTVARMRLERQFEFVELMRGELSGMIMAILEGIVMCFILLIICVVGKTKAWIIPGTEDMRP